VSRPDISKSEWQLVYLPSLVTKDLATAMGRPDSEGSHRFQVKPESIRTASPGSFNWFMQATPYDNLGHELPPKEMIGLMTFSFDLIILAANPIPRPTPGTPRGRARPSRTATGCATASRSPSGSARNREGQIVISAAGAITTTVVAPVAVTSFQGGTAQWRS
jgi:hypothetical protein